MSTILSIFARSDDARVKVPSRSHQGTEAALPGLHHSETTHQYTTRSPGSVDSVQRQVGNARMQEVQRRESATQSSVLCQEDEEDVLLGVHIPREQRAGAE